MVLHYLIFMLPVAMATLTPQLPRGERIIPTGADKSEICVIPKKYSGAIYSERDLKVEQRLCSLGNATPVALCPKLTSTNPAVEFHSVPTGLSSAQVEAKSCNVEGSEKYAKYKGSISCSYTPSLLAYYHVSRILGASVQVPPVVLRSLDLQLHRQIAAKGIAGTAGKADLSLLRQIWQGFAGHLNAPAKSSKKDTLFTDDLKQSYGALQENPQKEEKYSEMFFVARGAESRADAFRNRSPIYRLLADRRPLRQLVGGDWDAKNVQAVLQMSNVTDMIVLDTMLSQEDRFGNVHFTKHYYFKDSNGEPHIASSGSMEEEEARKVNAVVVKKMMLKDNDCGVARENRAKKARLIEGIAHISPETYTRVQSLFRDIESAEAKGFFLKETMMTSADFAQFEENVELVARTLKKACREGRLHLDLDMNNHFIGSPLAQSCE